jgi:hypothetical protein
VAREPIRLPRRVGLGGRTVEYAPNRWTPEEVERRFADEPVEWLYVFDPSGRQIARFRGTWRYVVRRPGDHWPTDEHNLRRLIVEIEGDLDRDGNASDQTQLAAAGRLRAILRRLAEEGWIDYESSLSIGGD